MSEFLGIDIKTFNDGGFHFYQAGLICKVLESTSTDHCNGFPTPTKFEALLGTDANVYEAKRYWPNSYASIIGMAYMVKPKPHAYVMKSCEMVC